MKYKSMSVEEYMASFYVKGTLNCVAISTIKAALNMYTFEELLQPVQLENKKIRVTLKDKYTLGSAEKVQAFANKV